METEEKKNERRWLLLQYQVSVASLKAAFAFLRAWHVEPVLIKGWAAAQNYPEPFLRSYVDVDLAVAPDKYLLASELLASHGKGLRVDLHVGLRHLDSTAWEDLFNNTRILDLDDVAIRVLRPEDHFRVLCTHWLNDGGAFPERLWDIYWAVSNRPPDFDWQRCLGAVSPTRREWVAKAIGAAQRYLGLDTSGIPLTEEELALPKWMTDTLEREWATDVRLIPLHACLRDRKLFFEQIRKRVPPNPIEATIETEGRFDEGGRLRYQAGSAAKRLIPSLKRIFNVLSRR